MPTKREMGKFRCALGSQERTVTVEPPFPCRFYRTAEHVSKNDAAEIRFHKGLPSAVSSAGGPVELNQSQRPQLAKGQKSGWPLAGPRMPRDRMGSVFGC